MGAGQAAAAPGPTTGHRGCPTAGTPEGPGAGCEAGGTKGAEDSPSGRVGLRRLLPASAARPPGHMARSRAEDQRGFVASEQGASQSAGRGRRDCLRGRAGSEGQGEGAGRRGPAGSRGVLSLREKRQGAGFPVTAGGRSHGRRDSSRKEGKWLTWSPAWRPCQEPVPAALGPSPGPALLGAAKNLTCPRHPPSLPPRPVLPLGQVHPRCAHTWS